MDDGNNLIADFIHTISKPEDTLLPLLFSKGNDAASIEGREQLRRTCQYLFQEVERLNRTYQSLSGKVTEDPQTLSGLDELYMGSKENPADAETLWGQVDMQNTALQSLLKKSMKRVIKSVEGNDEVRLLDMGEVLSEEENSTKSDDTGEEEKDNDEASSEEDEDEDEDEGEDDETRRIRERMERTMEGMDDSDSENGDDEIDSKHINTTSKNQSDEESLVDPAAEELNDGFFDINDMEAFADEEEAYLPEEEFAPHKPEETKPKKSFHQKQREGDIDSSSDEDEETAFGKPEEESNIKRQKYREDEEIDALYSMYENPQSDEEASDDDSVINMTAENLFGKPKKKDFEKWNSKKPKTPQEQGDDADSWDDHDFDEEDDNTGWRETHSDEENDDNDEVENSGEDTVEEKDDEEEVQPDDSLSAKKTDKLRKQTEQIEKEMLAEKPWQMTGESKSSSRPVNSLLEATPEFEVATKMAPIITMQHTENIEEMIKRRVLNEDWDDVAPRELPDVGWNKRRGELPEVSQEKSKLGLGELYEREFLKKAVGYDRDADEKQTEEGKAKDEMKALFASLCSKLDALSNYHFAPRPIADEAEVRAVTTPAIAMEEVMPLHVSDARGVAPEEVYGQKRGRDAVLRGDTELDQTERKRLRSAKKSARRKTRKEKLADEKLISRLQPGLGLNNPYEKRKMREELSMARASGRVTTGEEDTNADYGASAKFFRRMEEEVKNAVHGDKDSKQPKKFEDGHGKKSSSFKL